MGITNKIALKFFYTIYTLAVTLFLSACPIEQLFPGKVADGIARLTVANLGLMILGIKQQGHPDSNCDLLSKKTSANFKRLYKSKERGQVVWGFNDCIFDFGKSTNILDDNQKIMGTLSGKVTLSGHKIIEGYFTNSNIFPVIPEGENSFQFDFSHVHFENFQAQIPEMSKNLTILRGTLSFSLAIHLARSKSLHLCNIPLQNLTFKNIVYDNNQENIVRLPGFLGDYEVDIHASDLEAQQNTYQNHTNFLQGHIAIWGNNSKQVPSDNLGLNPSFKENAFEEDIQSIPDLDKPASYDCPVDRFLAIQASRLIIQNIGNIALELGQDNKCGPLRDSYWEQYKSTHTHSDSELKIPFKNCALHNSKVKKLVTDCHDVKTYVGGTASITGNTFITGKITYAYQYLPLITGIMRQDPQSVLFDFQKIILDNYESYDIMASEKLPKFLLRIKKGTLSAQVEPIFTEEKRCEFSKPTPIAYFYGVSLKEAKTTLVLNLKDIISSDDLFINFDLDITRTNLFAQNGFYNKKGNWLSGSIVISEKEHHLKGLLLHPFFDQEYFDSSYRCFVEKIIPPHQEWDPVKDCF
jgi:hypothetical protein